MFPHHKESHPVKQVDCVPLDSATGAACRDVKEGEAKWGFSVRTTTTLRIMCASCTFGEF